MAIDGMNDAVRAIGREADNALDWLTPPGEKNLLGADVAIAFAGLLVMSFLSGFREAASKDAKEKGEKTYHWLSNCISDLVGGKKKPAPTKEIEDLAEGAPKAGESLSEEDFNLAVVHTREKLVITLKTANLSEERAARIAAAVSQAAVTNVLKRKRQR